MGDLTEHFSLREFACHDGTPVPNELIPVVTRLAESLEVIRLACGGRPIHVISGYRTPYWNTKIGGAKHSQHLFGRAADIRIMGRTPDEVARLVDCLQRAGGIPEGGLGRYPRFTHVDIRGHMARWSGVDRKDDFS